MWLMSHITLNKKNNNIKLTIDNLRRGNRVNLCNNESVCDQELCDYTLSSFVFVVEPTSYVSYMCARACRFLLFLHPDSKSFFKIVFSRTAHIQIRFLIIVVAHHSLLCFLMIPRKHSHIKAP